MAVTTKEFFRGAATTSTGTTLYTTAATETSIITNIIAANTSASAQTVTIAIAGTAILSGVSVPANSTTAIDLKVPLIATGSTRTITGGASATSVNLFISGVTL